ncbi:MAG: Exodeoxyribonuclease 7 small subunit [Tenericutes bacterium ADurb.BinA155]|jgi:exodeoxyribonuclease VII small subunit|nr:MAG: Exodeoxyribonuclease 7 small subunit [Tenericutes bacterium ADurb.BinA155]
MAEEKVNFEQKLDRLNEIVTKIENETLPLETSISLYQEGLKLIKELETELKDAEKKIGQYKEIEK